MEIFRKIIFWIHLSIGVMAGLVIAVMCFTGVALAFEKEIANWFDRDVRFVALPPGDQTQLPLDDILGKVKEFKSGLKITTVSAQNDPRQALVLTVSRSEVYYANPYTGEIKPQAAGNARKLMELMVNWHRWLAIAGDNRPVGKAITGACNLGFLFLACSGLYLWFPRKFNWPAFRAVLMLNPRLRGKARDWNWHNAIGFWAAPVLIVLTITASIISYRWATNLVYTLTNSTPPPAPGQAVPGPAVSIPAPDAKPLPFESFFTAAKKQFPGWDQIIYRVTSAGRTPTQPSESKASAPPLVLSVRDAELNPEFTLSQLTFNPYTAEVIKAESYSDYNTGRKVRTWMRFLHTGEALGFIGKAIAGLASALGLFLVYTGFALTLRRLFGWKAKEKIVLS